MSSPDHAGNAESLRQQALLAGLAAPRAAPGASAGLRAYRANAHALAKRALAGACPTLAALLGDEDFGALAREFWHAHPPVHGDIGEWGDALPGWIAAHPGLTEWPYLADCARLDLALHRCERAADAEPDAASLALLASADPAHLRLRLMPGTAVIFADWPVASIHAAHVVGDGAEAAFDRARERIRDRLGEIVIVAREGWRGVGRRTDAATGRFMQALADGVDLAGAIDAGGDGFDFSAWLADALRSRWLQGIEPARD